MLLCRGPAASIVTSCKGLPISRALTFGMGDFLALPSKQGLHFAPVIHVSLTPSLPAMTLASDLLTCPRRSCHNCSVMFASSAGNNIVRGLQRSRDTSWPVCKRM